MAAYLGWCPLAFVALMQCGVIGLAVECARARVCVCARALVDASWFAFHSVSSQPFASPPLSVPCRCRYSPAMWRHDPVCVQCGTPSVGYVRAWALSFASHIIGGDWGCCFRCACACACMLMAECQSKITLCACVPPCCFHL